jgi:branched-chain amino acid transport system ATP-binding protein
MLTLNNVEVIYDNVILVLKGVSLEVRDGTITTLLGANGAGKSTTLKAISGVLRTERGEVTKGSIELNGERIDRVAPYDMVKRGVAQVFEGRRVFEHLTTEENLTVGAHIQSDRARVASGIERVYQYFPRLKERGRCRPVTFRAASSRCWSRPRVDVRPRHILLDEPSLGLAPMLVEGSSEIVGLVAAALTVLLVRNATPCPRHRPTAMSWKRAHRARRPRGFAPRQRRHQGFLGSPVGARRRTGTAKLQAPEALAELAISQREEAHATDDARRIDGPCGPSSPACASAPRSPPCISVWAGARRQRGRGRRATWRPIRVNSRFKPGRWRCKAQTNLADQICDATGGPCAYLGRDMKAVHTGMGITETEWNATVEDLVKSLTKFKVPAKEQQELLAILGPMKKDIVGQ